MQDYLLVVLDVYSVHISVSICASACRYVHVYRYASIQIRVVVYIVQLDIAVHMYVIMQACEGVQVCRCAGA